LIQKGYKFLRTSRF